MRVPFLPVWSRIVWLAVGVLAVLAVADAGAVVMTRLSTPDRTREAGQAAAQAVAGHVITQAAVVRAYDAARDSAAAHAVAIATDDFRVLRDGRVQLTGSRTAPTLVVHRLPVLRGYVVVSASDTVSPLPYQGAP